MAARILKILEVMRRTSVARSTIYLRISEGTFPKPISLGHRSVGWIESEIDEWITDKIKLSRQTQEG